MENQFSDDKKLKLMRVVAYQLSGEYGKIAEAFTRHMDSISISAMRISGLYDLLFTVKNRVPGSSVIDSYTTNVRTTLYNMFRESLVRLSYDVDPVNKPVEADEHMLFNFTGIPATVDVTSLAATGGYVPTMEEEFYKEQAPLLYELVEEALKKPSPPDRQVEIVAAIKAHNASGHSAEPIIIPSNDSRNDTTVVNPMPIKIPEDMPSATDAESAPSLPVIDIATPSATTVVADASTDLPVNSFTSVNTNLSDSNNTLQQPDQSSVKVNLEVGTTPNPPKTMDALANRQQVHIKPRR
jgi:hypothetical protein